MKIQFLVLHLTVGLSFQSCQEGTTRSNGCVPETCKGGKWIPNTNLILEKCKKCHAYGDPHFETFSGARFLWWYGCNYALVQDGSSMNPEFGVFMKFRRHGTVSYIGRPTTYQENPNTKVVLNPSNLFNVAVNGQNQEIGDSTTPTLLFGPRSAPTSVYAWKHKDTTCHSNTECLRIYGKHQILVELCSTTISIWAPPQKDYPVTLGGFCGRTDDTPLLIGRDGTNYGNPGSYNKPAPDGFGDSWEAYTQETNCRTAEGRFKRSLRKQRSIEIHSNCYNHANSGSGDHHENCMGVHDGPIGDDHLSACVYDLCTVTSDPEHQRAGFNETWILDQHREVHGRRKIHEYHNNLLVGSSGSIGPDLSVLVGPSGIIGPGGSILHQGSFQQSHILPSQPEGLSPSVPGIVGQDGSILHLPSQPEGLSPIAPVLVGPSGSILPDGSLISIAPDSVSKTNFQSRRRPSGNTNFQSRRPNGNTNFQQRTRPIGNTNFQRRRNPQPQISPQRRQ